MKAPPVDIERIVYLGTPALAVPPLRALHRAGYDIPLVVTGADAKRGRGGAVSPSPVKKAASELGLPVSHRVDDTLDVAADLGVVVAYGRLIKPHVLDRLAMVNMHFSLLPRWRGAAPVERALLAGDEVTGVCLMVLDVELAVGDLYRCAEVPIGPDATLESLRAELVEVGTDLLLEALDEGLGEPVPQQGEVTWASKIDPAELELDWSRPAAQLDRVVRVGNAWTTLRGSRLKIWRVAAHPGGELAPGQVDGIMVGTGDGLIELVEVQPEGRPRRSAWDWARGARLDPTDRLGS